MWVIADTCYSGELVRSSFAPISSELPARLLTLRGVQVRPRYEKDHLSANASAKLERAPYPYSRVQFLAAAASGELAREIPFDQLAKLPTRDKKPHGALTDALLRVLHSEIAADLNRDGLLSLHEVQIACAEFMASRPYNHSALRLPNLHEDRKSLGQQAVLSARNVALKARPGALPALKLYVGPGLADMGLSQLQVQEVAQAALQAAVQIMLDANNAEQVGSANAVGYVCGAAVNKSAWSKVFSYLQPNLAGAPAKIPARLLYLAATRDNEVAYATSKGSRATRAWHQCLHKPISAMSGNDLMRCAQAKLDAQGDFGSEQNISLLGDGRLRFSFKPES